MSRRDFWISILIIVTIFALGVMVGMCVQVLGVPAHAEVNNMSGMPCENPEQFERWYKTYEPQTEQETSEAGVRNENSKGDAEIVDRSWNTFSDQRSAEDTAESEQTEAAQTQTEVTLYLVDGVLIDPEIQQKLYQYLKEEKIEYWFTGALAQMFQESGGDPFAENKNGLDKGLFQYRITYWTEQESIFDVDAQLRRYVREVASRLNAGLSVDEVISRHNTSDYVTTINWEYVDQVKQWLNKLEKF